MDKYVKISMKEHGFAMEYEVTIEGVSIKELMGCVICLTKYIEEKTSKTTDE